MLKKKKRVQYKNKFSCVFVGVYVRARMHAHLFVDVDILQ